ncbi:Destabilase [Nesidiocoris tenuis]|nr:Destabilase [Nesidiocoris tenuis]
MISAAVIAFAFVHVLGQQQQNVVPDICLGCICEAISDCNITTACNGDVCGLFRITWPYWSDAGKPVLKFDNPQDPGAYQRCVTDPSCGAQAVNGYMAKFGQDCNNDGNIDCWDFAAIHKLGGYNCRQNIDPVYWAKFSNCQQQVAQLGLGNGRR